MSGTYDSSEFDHIKYMATSGGVSCPDSDLRNAYYGITGFPTLIWLGLERMVGAGSDVVDGVVYNGSVQAHIVDATPVSISYASWDLVGGDVSIDVALEDDMPGSFMVRAFVVENNLLYGGTNYQDVLRDMIIETPLTISTAGQSQALMQSFTVDPSWKLEDLRIITIVQDESTKEVMQAANTLSAGPYAFRYYSLGDRVVLTSGTHQYGDFALFNTGENADTFDLSLDLSELPGDWSAHITDGVDTWTSLSVSLNPGERAVYNVVIVTASPGGHAVALNIHSQNARTPDRQVAYSIITPDTEVLLVDDDGGEAFETDYYAPALSGTGRSFGIWDRSAAEMTAELLNNFDAVVWNVGFNFPTLDDDDRAALATYLDAGGALFISGQDVGWDHNDQGGAAILWYRNYLNANYIADDTNDYTLYGVPGDAISDGMSITISGGDGANNQEYPDDIDPYDADAHVILSYNASQNGAIAADTGTYRVVYLAFGFEAINNATDRAQVMQRSMDWLLPDLTAVPGATPMALRLDQNLPNPFNPKTDIRFALPAAGAVSLRVFDVEGRQVRVLAEGPYATGEHTVTWDGKNDAGQTVPSGVYFYRLAGDTESRTRKMLMMK